MTDVRPYRGVQAGDRVAERRRRLLDAGLELLGGSDSPPDLTVRAVCAEAGITARYFYESFTDKDALVAAVFDRVVADIAATTQAAVAAAPPGQQNRAGMANIVHIVDEDPRLGRLLFSARLSNPVIVSRRSESGVLLARLYGREFETEFGLHPDASTKAVAHFAVGGVGQVISAWLTGDVAAEPADVVELLATMLDALAGPRLASHGAVTASPPAGV